MPDILKQQIEELELASLNLVENVLREKFNDYINGNSQMAFNDLLLALSRQGKGRATTSYRYTTEDVVRSYLNGSLNADAGKELRCRIAACPLFKVALERFVEHSLISWFTSKNIQYTNYNLSTSADFAVFVKPEALKRLLGMVNENSPAFANEHRGIILSVDAKSVMALSNLGDALSRNGHLGKFETNWNQISYVPPVLRRAMASNDGYYNKKYNPIEPLVALDGNEYVLVSIFACDLVCLSDRAFFQAPLESLTGARFNHYCTIVSIPNRLLQSEYYDTFFDAGKGGISDDGVAGFPNYSVDARFNILNSNVKALRFENLYSPQLRFRYLNQVGRYNAITYSNANLEDNEFSLYDTHPRGTTGST